MPREPSVHLPSFRPVREEVRVLQTRVRQRVSSVSSVAPERLDGVTLVRVARPRHEHGVPEHELGDGAGQILRFLRVPAGVGQQGRLADVLGRASDELRVRVRSWRVVVVVVRRRTQPDVAVVRHDACRGFSRLPEFGRARQDAGRDGVRPRVPRCPQRGGAVARGVPASRLRGVLPERGCHVPRGVGSTASAEARGLLAPGNLTCAKSENRLARTPQS